MIASTDRGHHLAARLGVGGAALGVLAGLFQALAGARFPDWTGAKAAPVSLGLLTIAASLLAGFAAAAQDRPERPTGVRAVCSLGVLLPALLCFTTVGRLWYLPGPILLISGIVMIERWRDTAEMIARNWLRCLLSILGATEVLMAAGAAPLLMAVGAVGGLALIAAAWLPASPIGLGALVIIGTAPFRGAWLDRGRTGPAAGRRGGRRGAARPSGAAGTWGRRRALHLTQRR